MSRRARKRKLGQARNDAPEQARATQTASREDLALAGDLTPSEGDSYDPPVVARESDKGKKAPDSFGDSLRRQRELRGISLREVSEATKINVRYLEALERNDFSFLPAGAFTRGFIRSYAHQVGLDETEVIDAYLYELGKQEAEREEGDTGDETVFRDPLRESAQRAQAEGEKRKKRTRIIVLVAVVIVVAIIASLATMFLLHQTRTVSRNAAETPTLERSLRL